MLLEDYTYNHFVGVAGLRQLESTVWRYVFYCPITLPVNVFSYLVCCSVTSYTMLGTLLLCFDFCWSSVGENLRENGNTRL